MIISVIISVNISVILSVITFLGICLHGELCIQRRQNEIKRVVHLKISYFIVEILFLTLSHVCIRLIL